LPIYALKAKRPPCRKRLRAGNGTLQTQADCPLFLAICLLISFGSATGVPAQTNKRVALVIGNADYRNVSRLSNPNNDALDVEVSFRRLRFSVSRILNANFDSMRRAVGEFTRQAQGAEIAIVFYAGHGMEVAGENWLIPVDAELPCDTSLETEAIGLRISMLAVSNSSSPLR
jgi:Caspase domain